VPQLVFDLGGTFLRCGVAHDDGTVRPVVRTRIRNFLDGSPAAEVWRSIFSELALFAKSVDDLLSPNDGVVLAFPGPIRDGRRIVGAPTVVGDADIPDVAETLERLLRRPVRLINDVSAAAWHLAKSTPVDRFMVVTVSSGIGNKVFDRRHPLRVLDDASYGGEIGHCIVDRSIDAPRCDCGERGHLGAIASGRGTLRLARARAVAHDDSFSRSLCVRQFGASALTLTNEDHLVPAIRMDDAWAISCMRDAMTPLADVIGSVTFACGIGKVCVIGGFPIGIGPQYIRCLNDLLKPPGRMPSIGLPDGDFAELADMHPEACLLGAAEFGRRLAFAHA